MLKKIVVSFTLLFLTANIFAAQIKNNYSSSGVSGLKNPERGLYDSKYDAILTTSILNSVPYTVIHRYYYLTEATKSSLSTTRLANIKTDLQNIVATGKKIIPRFAYTSDGNGSDAPLSIIKTHIDQLAPILNQFLHVIITLQAGFIGPWGEWHDSKNNVDKQQLLNYLLSKFKGSVSLRYPYDRMKYGGSSVSRIGFHNDCFLYDKSDRGTYTTSGYTTETSYFKTQSLNVPVGGETCGVADSARTQCPVALSELATYHWTYLNAGFSNDNINQLKNGGCWNQITDRLGYSLYLTSTTISHAVYNVKSGQDMTFSFSISNKGFAAPLSNRPYVIVFRTGTTSFAFTLSGTSTFKSLVAGKVTVVNGKIAGASLKAKSSSMVGKTLEARLVIPDSNSALASKAAYSVGFVNQGVYETSSGQNILGLSVKFSNSNTLEEFDETEVLVEDSL